MKFDLTNLFLDIDNPYANNTMYNGIMHSSGGGMECFLGGLQICKEVIVFYP